MAQPAPLFGAPGFPLFSGPARGISPAAATTRLCPRPRSPAREVRTGRKSDAWSLGLGAQRQSGRKTTNAFVANALHWTSQNLGMFSFKLVSPTSRSQAGGQPPTPARDRGDTDATAFCGPPERRPRARAQVPGEARAAPASTAQHTKRRRRRWCWRIAGRPSRKEVGIFDHVEQPQRGRPVPGHPAELLRRHGPTPLCPRWAALAPELPVNTPPTLG